MRHNVRLEGVRPEPLASYLKAIAVLRIVGEQVDATATGAWDGETFVLTSVLDEEALVRFFTGEWAPTPLVAPWNGGSGFHPNDKAGIAAIAAITATTSSRFAPYREAIEVGRKVLASSPEVDKDALVARLRARLPDDGIRWLDAAIVLTTTRLAYPPLLGTGGNDGRLEFSSNQMQRLVGLLITPDDPELAARQLRSALTGAAAPRTLDAIGQFAPAQAGGANTGMGFSRDSLINPWDFVLALEGALTFAASASRALDASGRAAFPFFVRSTSAGFASSSANEQSRGELWLPLWQGPATAGEIATLIGEGRAWVDGRVVESAADFGRAIRQLGVARGITSFQRFVLAQRNGLAFFATSAGRYHVASAPAPDPLTPLDYWLRSVRRIVEGDDNCPASVRVAARSVDDAILDTSPTTSGARLLLALSDLAWAVTRSRRHRAFESLPPMPQMARGSWPSLARSTDPAWRLAFLLAQGELRRELQPVAGDRRLEWESSPREIERAPDVPIIDRLLRVGRRRLLGEPRSYVAPSPGNATLSDFARLASGAVDLHALGAAVDAATLCDEDVEPVAGELPADAVLTVGAKLCAAALHGPPDTDDGWVIPADMLHALMAGAGERAVALARRHLLARDVPIELPVTALDANGARVLCVALLLPLSLPARRAVWRAVTAPSASLTS